MLCKKYTGFKRCWNTQISFKAVFISIEKLRRNTRIWWAQGDECLWFLCSIITWNKGWLLKLFWVQIFLYSMLFHKFECWHFLTCPWWLNSQLKCSVLCASQRTGTTCSTSHLFQVPAKHTTNCVSRALHRVVVNVFSSAFILELIWTGEFTPALHWLCSVCLVLRKDAHVPKRGLSHVNV